MQTHFQSSRRRTALANLSFVIAAASAAAAGAPPVPEANLTPQGAPPTVQSTVAQANPQEAKPTATDHEFAFDEVKVKAKKPAKGKVEDGYRVDSVNNVGPWSERALQDTPYSINVMPSELLENLQAQAIADAFKYNPYTQIYIPAQRIGVDINMRGFFSSKQTVNGLLFYGQQTLEDKDRIEVMTGTTGFMYGISSPAGNINYVTKRPTDNAMAEVTVGQRERSDRFIHGDVGGPLNAGGTLAYRLNLDSEGGETFLRGQTINKQLATAALDWRALDNLKFEFDASSLYDKENGMQVAFNPANGVLLSHVSPAIVDPTVLYGQKWSYDLEEVNQYGGKVTWNISNAFTFRSAVLNEVSGSHRLNVNCPSFNVVTGNYSESIYDLGLSEQYNTSVYAYLDAGFSTGSVSHKITTGISGNNEYLKSSPNGSYSGTIAGLSSNIQNPIYVDPPAYKIGTGPRVIGSSTDNRNLMLGDDIKFNQAWSALIGVNNASIDAISYNQTTGAQSSVYDKTKATPSVSFLYKPVPAVTTYVTFLEALEQGGTAPSTFNALPVTNAGAILAPMVDTQYEAGAKATLGGSLLTLALFDIDKGNQYVDPGSLTYVQSGREVHKGVELTETGTLFTGFRLYGGATWLSARIQRNTNTPAYDGKVPTNVPETTLKLVGEYDIPKAPGLTVTGGGFYAGSYYSDSLNTNNMPAVATYDLGARYKMLVNNLPLIMRLNVSNVADKRSWMFGIPGDPRVISVSASMKFF